MEQTPDTDSFALADVLEHLTPVGQAELDNGITRMLLAKEREKNAVLIAELAELRERSVVLDHHSEIHTND